VQAIIGGTWANEPQMCTFCYSNLRFLLFSLLFRFPSFFVLFFISSFFFLFFFSSPFHLFSSFPQSISGACGVASDLWEAHYMLVENYNPVRSG
jgi:hypothetical protein